MPNRRPAIANAVVTALPLSGATPPQRIKLLPAGSIQAVDGRAWTLSDPAAVVAASLAAEFAALGGRLPIDYDHAIDLALPKGGRAPAAGWITGLDAAADGVYATVEWTPDGSKALAGREYRYVSPAFLFDGANAVTRILRASLTNFPALPQLGALAHATPQGVPPMDELLKQLRALFGVPDADEKALLAQATAAAGTHTALAAAVNLPATTKPGDVIAAVKTLAATAQTARDGLSAVALAAGLPATATAQEIAAAVQAAKGGGAAVALLSARLQALETALAASQDKAVQDKVDEAIKAGKFTPAQRDAMLALCRSNPALFDQIAATAVPVMTPGPAVPPGAPTAGNLTSEQRAICANLGLKEEDYKKALAGGVS